MKLVRTCAQSGIDLIQSFSFTQVDRFLWAHRPYILERTTKEFITKQSPSNGLPCCTPVTRQLVHTMGGLCRVDTSQNLLKYHLLDGRSNAIFQYYYTYSSTLPYDLNSATTAPSKITL